MSKNNELLAISCYIKKRHVLTLCVGNNTELWAANCFYIYDETKVVFYIMTDISTHHGDIMLKNPLIAGTVGSQSKTVMLLKGIQFSGKARKLQDEEMIQVFKRYTQRFPIARNFSSPIWCLRIDLLKMTDNTAGFGTKRHWNRYYKNNT